MKKLKNPKIMYPLFFTLALFIQIGPLSGQTFILDNSAISTTMSDSRSVNFFDLNNDGFQEIYISNGLSTGEKDLLYRNIAGGTMIPVTGMDITEAQNPSDGASFADYNQDGHVDAIVSSWYGSEDLLYLNSGNAKLNYNGNAGIATGSFAETAVFGDYDNDGWIDIYITHSGGDRKNFLYKNLKDGKFERITNHILVSDSKLSRGAIWGDFNDDGFQDLFITNESNTKNDLFFGSSDSNYTRLTSGSIVNSSKGSMTASCGDIDNDGDLDIFVGNSGFFSGQANQLFINNNGSFTEATTSELAKESKCTFGSAFADYDNDGDLDLAVSNGFCNGGMANELFENQGDGTFMNVSHLLIENKNICSFGLAWGDIDNDGFLDLMIANCKNNSSDISNPNTLLRNQGNTNNWIQIRLEGTTSNFNALGAKVMLLANINGENVWQRRDVSAQTGYSGQNSMVNHFGLADATQIDSMVIFWPSGNIEYFSSMAANQIITIEEGFTSGVGDINHPPTPFKVFPNPIKANKNHFQMTFDNIYNYDNIYVRLLDLNGRSLYAENHKLIPNINNITIDLKNEVMSLGIYQVVLESQSSLSTQKLVVVD